MKSLFIVAVLAVVLCVALAILSFSTVWTINLDNGEQNYRRHLFGIEFGMLSEYRFYECNNTWENPQIGLVGEQIISTCSIVFGCKNGSVSSKVVSIGCRL